MRWVGLAAAVAIVGVLACVRRPAPSGEPGTKPQSTAKVPLELALPEHPSGQIHDLAVDRGQVVLLDVWATWCEPCKDALPTYERLLAQYGPRGFRAFAINVDEDDRQVSLFLAEARVGLTILRDPGAVQIERVLPVQVMPTTFLLDRRGVVRYVHEGFAEEFWVRYQTEIEKLLSE